MHVNALTVPYKQPGAGTDGYHITDPVRDLGRYVRDQKLMPLTEAIRKITSMPAQRHHLVGRGQLQVGYFGDITIFDPDRIIDRATYTEPTKLSEGIDTVLVNGQVEYEHSALTGVNAGRALRGPGWSN